MPAMGIYHPGMNANAACTKHLVTCLGIDLCGIMDA